MKMKSTIKTVPDINYTFRDSLGMTGKKSPIELGFRIYTHPLFQLLFCQQWMKVKVKTGGGSNVTRPDERTSSLTNLVLYHFYLENSAHSTRDEQKAAMK